MADRALVVGSMSKSHAMTGSRVGRLIGPEAAIARVADLSTHTSYGVAGFVQDAALHALSLGPGFEARIAEPFRRRHAACLARPEGERAIGVVPSGGGMYLMPDIRGTGLSGTAFAARLLEERHVAVMPVASFGRAAAGHLRLALTRRDAELSAALDTIVAFTEELTPMTGFRNLHRPGDPFILANAWDVGSARMLVALGARAIATSSAGYAFTRGLPDGGRVGREEAIAHAKDLAGHVDVPVSADLEDGYGPDPADCAATVELAGLAGLAGCCIEDVAADGSAYGFEVSVARIDAAVKAARRAPHDFVFCARADGVLRGCYGIGEAIRRLQAFEAVGADVLYCPMPDDMEDLKRLVAAVSAPVNALVAGRWTKVTQAAFAEAGVARISLGSSLARTTHRVIRDAGRAMFGNGDFSGLGGIAGDEVDGYLRR